MADLVAQYRTSGSHGLFCNRVPTENGFQLIVQEYRGSSNKSSRDIRAGDEIRTVAGITVNNPLELELALIDVSAGETIDIEIDRNGESVVQSVVLQRPTIASEEGEIQRAAWDQLGVRVTAVPASAISGLSNEYKGGLKITEVRPGSLASREHLNPGDVIVGVMDWQTPTLKTLAWIMANNSFQTAASVKYYLIRKNRPLTIAVSPDRTRR